MINIFKVTRNLVLSKQKTIFASAVIVALTIIFSRLFGFLRYRILAGYFTKSELDIFFASFRIPDIIFEILITGAVTSVFIPVFIKYQKDKDKLNENISSIMNVVSLLFFGFVLILFVFADKIIPLMTPGFSPEKVQTIVFYSRILLVCQLPFMIFASFLTGLGQANKIFILSAIAPIAYNVAIILSTILLTNNFHLLAPILGVAIGAVILFIIQLPLIFSSEFVYKPIVKLTSGLTEFFRMVVPRIVTVIMTQIDATIDLMLSSLLGAGSYTVFYLAQHLQLLPVSMIGMAFGQASLPYLAELYQNKKTSQFQKIITESILAILFLTVPIMSFLIIARTPLVRLFFGGEKFDWEATVQTAITLSYFALSVPLHALYYFITRCFYAFLDSKTPFIVSSLSTVLNIILSLLFIFVFKLPVWSLAISFSIAISINVLVLIYLLSKKVEGLNNKLLFIESTKILGTTFISAFFVYWGMKLLDGLILDTTRTINVFLLLIIGGISLIGLYIFLSWLLGVKEFYIIKKITTKAKEYRKRIIEVYTVVE